MQYRSKEQKFTVNWICFYQRESKRNNMIRKLRGSVLSQTEGFKQCKEIKEYANWKMAKVLSDY